MAKSNDMLDTIMCDAYDALNPHNYDERLLAFQLVILLSYLKYASGKDTQDFHRVGRYFLLKSNWKYDWNHTSPEMAEILDDIAGTLHDSVDSPEIAENFESTPDQLLNRLRVLFCLR